MAVTANIHEAKTTLSKLIERALAGEEVIIAKAGKPLVHLTPVAEAKPAKKSRGIVGCMEGQIWFAPDWDSPETNAEIEHWFYEGDDPAEPLRGVAEE
jgi:prevent-host-death family protein